MSHSSRPIHAGPGRRRGALLATTALLAGVAGAVAGPASATPSTGVVLDQVFGGGGNTGSTYRQDYIELADRGSTDQDVSTWSVQYHSASATSTSWQVTPLSGSILAGKTFLIGEAIGTGGTTDLPAPDVANGQINLGGTNGTVALVRSSAALTCQTAADCSADASIVDLLGYGSAPIVESTAAAAPADASQAETRTSAADTDNNSTDFADRTTAPVADPVAGGPGAPTPGALRIHDIQGSTWVSPQNGNTVSNVPGIVTAIRTSSNKGYWIQDPTPDDNPATSEGLFVYTGSTPTVSVGDSVLVSGKVSDYYTLSSGQTLSTTSNLSVTELSASTVRVLSSGATLPAPIMLTPTTVPAHYAPDLGGGNIENTPITPARSALDFYESIEGMRVEVDNARVVGPSDSYGEQYVTTKPDQTRSYRGGTLLTAENATPSGRLEVAAADGSNPDVSVGDEFTGATVGPVDYTIYGGYEMIATALGTVRAGNLEPVVARPAGKQLSIATYNVENLMPTDPATKYSALAKGIVTDLAAPDIIAVEEVQDNSGATDDGAVRANQTLVKLTAAISAAGGPGYRWRVVNPVNDRDGGQPGGNIRVVFLFDPKRVSFVDAGASAVNRSVTGTAVVRRDGRAALSMSPGRIDPTNPVWTSSRKPLVGQFSFRGRSVFVIANHFDAKLGDQNADGRYQFPQRSSEIQRAGQAAAVHDFVDSIMAIDKHADVVVVGDLNDYQFSPALHILTSGNAAGTGQKVLTDLIATLPANQQYTYDYNGISQVLDHILVARHSRAATAAGVGRLRYQVVHINAEFANQTSDHDPQVMDITP